MNASHESLQANKADNVRSSEAAVGSQFLLFIPFAALFLIVLCAAGCAAKEEKHYPIQAEVISVDLPKRLIVVKHGEIPGLMPAMTMSYAIGVPKEAEALGPGDKISADLVVSENRGRLEKIVLLEKAKPNPVPASTTETAPHPS